MSSYIYISPERQMLKMEPQSPQFKIEKDISIFSENIQHGYNEIIGIFNEWKLKMKERISEIKHIEHDHDLEKSLFGMSCDLMKKNKEIFDKSKEYFADNAKTMKLAFESLTLNVEIEKKTLEIKDLNTKLAFLESKITNEKGDLTGIYQQLANNKEIQTLHQSFFDKSKLYEELFEEYAGIQDKYSQLKKKLEELSIENSNLKIKLVENDLRNDNLQKQLDDGLMVKRSLKAENQEKCEILISLETKLEMILNENEKLTGILNEKLSIIERLNFELEKLKITSESKANNEVKYWKLRYEEKNSKSADIGEAELRKLEERSRILFQNNEKLSNEIVFLVKELENRNVHVSKAAFSETKLLTEKQNIYEKLNIIISLNEHLNDIIMINSEEMNSLKEQKEKFEQREAIISSLLEENNSLRSYFNKNFIDLEEKNLMKLMIQQNEQEMMALKEEREDLLKFKEIYVASEKIVQGDNYYFDNSKEDNKKLNNSYLR